MKGEDNRGMNIFKVHFDTQESSGGEGPWSTLR
jgi:hypothetical protein